MWVLQSLVLKIPSSAVKHLWWCVPKIYSLCGGRPGLLQFPNCMGCMGCMACMGCFLTVS